ncbi:FecR family protein [Paraflavitalea pollutisoli]|uniref:FecR family protein n=1 Tax=Paraflavitalea pollutisoli TaxID=3034143 RepID=UPI0023EAC237|nr:FecR family protein [Paraflavitalea sp. H1-2-19X]
MNDMNEIISLIRKDLRGELTPAEAELLNAWAAADPAYAQLMVAVHEEAFLSEELRQYGDTYNDEQSTSRMQAIVQRGLQSAVPAPLPRRWKMGRRWLTAAAVLVLAAGSWWWLQTDTSQPVTPTLTMNEIRPGSNKATLTLANGERVALDSTAGGIIAGSHQVMYADSTLAATNTPTEDDRLLNTLSTPQGGQYKIVLPDGSTVWLNAMTTLRYPTVFAANERVVELEGEAYFEVVHRADAAGHLQGFVVKSKGQEVRVLGTSFNINAYADERKITTTLVSGAVQVRNLYTGGSHRLEPGLRSQVNAELTTVLKADVFSATAWKDGLFSFRDAGVEELMKQLRRWYGVEVSFEGTIPTMSINGEVDRNMPASKVFEVLDYLEIAFRIDNNRIIISNKK